MISLCASPLDSLTSEKTLRARAARLLMTTMGCFISLCLAAIPGLNRAIWSAAAPCSRGNDEFHGLVRLQAARAVAGPMTANGDQERNVPT